MEGPRAPVPGPTLGRVLQSVGPLVEALSAPRGLDVAVTDAVIHDPAVVSPIEPGDVVLAVGTEPHRGIELVQLAGSCGAAAVAFRLRGQPPPALLEAAEVAGVALLGLPAELSWGQFHSLVRTALAGAGQPPPEGAEAPVGDLFALANAVAAMVGGPVTIEDPAFRVLAYSSLEGQTVDELRMQTILGRRSPAAWMRRFRDAGFIQRVLSTDEIVHVEGIPEEGVLPRVAIRVRAGDEVLGSIWVIAAGAGHPVRAESLREAARIAALHLMRHRTTEDLERRFRGDLLRSLLDGRGPADALAAQLGVEPEGAFAVLAFELHAAGEGELAMQRERTLELVAVWAEAFRRRAASVARGRTVYTLLPVATDTTPQRLVELAEDIRRRVRASLGVELRAAVGSTVPRIHDVPQSRAEADQVLRVLAREPGRGPVGSIEQLRAHTVLLELEDLAHAHPGLRRGKLERLVESDAGAGTRYLETLRTWFACDRDAVRAARALNIHPNTFRHRLRRITEVSGIDLRDPDERLVTELQLRFL